MNLINNRTTTNIDVDDDDAIFINEDFGADDSRDFEKKAKRQRSNNSDQMKMFEILSNDMKQNQMKKMELLHQAIQPRNELELFFSSVCKTVEKFTPLDQAKVKSTISRIVSDMEIAHIQNMTISIEELPLLME